VEICWSIYLYRVKGVARNENLDGLKEMTALNAARHSVNFPFLADDHPLGDHQRVWADDRLFVVDDPLEGDPLLDEEVCLQWLLVGDPLEGDPLRVLEDDPLEGDPLRVLEDDPLADDHQQVWADDRLFVVDDHPLDDHQRVWADDRLFVEDDLQRDDHQQVWVDGRLFAVDDLQRGDHQQVWADDRLNVADDPPFLVDVDRCVRFFQLFRRKARKLSSRQAELRVQCQMQQPKMVVYFQWVVRVLREDVLCELPNVERHVFYALPH